MLNCTKHFGLRARVVSKKRSRVVSDCLCVVWVFVSCSFLVAEIFVEVHSLCKRTSLAEKSWAGGLCLYCVDQRLVGRGSLSRLEGSRTVLIPLC